jgi:hypothetical protein
VSKVAAEKKPRKSFFKVVEPEAEPVQAPVQEKRNLLQTLMDFLKEKSEKKSEKPVEAPKVEQPKPVEAVVGEEAQERKVSLLGKAFAAPINGVKGAVSIVGSVGSKVVSAPAKGVKGAAGVVGSVGSKVLSPIKGAADAVGSTGSKLLSGPIKGVKAVRSAGSKVLSVPVKGAKGAAGVFGSVRSNVKAAPGKGLQGVKSACEAVGHGAAATGGAVGRVVRRIVKLPIVIVKLPANVLGGKKKKTAAKATAQTSGSRGENLTSPPHQASGDPASSPSCSPASSPPNYVGDNHLTLNVLPQGEVSLSDASLQCTFYLLNINLKKANHPWDQKSYSSYISHCVDFVCRGFEHEVKRTDALFSLARKYKTTSDQILADNKFYNSVWRQEKRKGTEIQEGEILCINEVSA